MTVAESPASEAPQEPKRGFSLPSAYTILFALIIVVAVATWIVPAGVYDLDEEGQPIPGTYHQVEQNPQRIIIDSLLAPINGLYGIEGEDGSIDVWNSGELFGAIDVALFILVIGGFLGVTMQTGAIQGGIARIVQRFKGREQWMIPILMSVFALGGTTYGMAEESLAFYVLIVTVMIAAGYDALVGASLLLLGCGIGVLGSTINPFATGIASGFAGTTIDEGLIGRLIILVIGTAIGIVLRDALRRTRQGRSEQVARLFAEGRERGSLPGGRRDEHRRRRAADRPAEAGAGHLLPGLRGDDLRRHPVGGPGHRSPHPVVVVPGDDGLVPVLRDPDRRRSAGWARRTSRRPSSMAPGICWAWR